MNPEIEQKLRRAIRQLLNAGWNTRAIADALAKQASFGKHDGCTPTAIKEMADADCRELNAAIRRENAQVMRLARRSLCEALAEMGVGR